MAHSIVFKEHKPFKKPTPENFDVFFPWACTQFQLPFDVVITRIQNKIASERKLSLGSKKSTSRSKLSQKSKSKINIKNIISKPETEAELHFNGFSHLNLTDINEIEPKIEDFIIYAYYDNSYLVKLKFDKNRQIPQKLLKVLGLVLKYHSTLINITINRGLNNQGLYELNELLKLSKITEVCLDDTFNANYDILLKDITHLRLLSLSRCSVDDEILRCIASNLSYSLPASKTLRILNLSSNRITDVGAKFLAEALKTNRKLSYLNLAGNMISDEGSEAILDVLKQFILSSEEFKLYEANKITNWKDKYQSKMLLARAEENKASASVTTTIKKTSRKSNATAAHKRISPSLELDEIEVIHEHPFTKINTYVADGVMYCYGNNHLAYLNLSYNNVSYLSVKKLLHVLTIQNTLARKPRGLVNASIEGNYIPDSCLELRQIDDILDSVLKFYLNEKQK